MPCFLWRTGLKELGLTSTAPPSGLLLHCNDRHGGAVEQRLAHPGQNTKTRTSEERCRVQRPLFSRPGEWLSPPRPRVELRAGDGG
jgi:hypothetical protein